MTILPILVAVGVFAILAVVLRIAGDLRAIRSELIPDLQAAMQRQAGSSSGLAAPHMSMPHSGHAFHGMPAGSFAVWEWRDGGWVLASKDLPEGTDPGPPPAYPGAYAGELVKTWIPGSKP